MPRFSCSFTVCGEPVPKGSMKAFVNKALGRAQLVDSNPGMRAWSHAMAQEASRHRPALPLDGPLAVRAEFFLKRPLSSKPSKVPRPAKKPDLDKLVRALLDACTAAGLWQDDARVVQVEASKWFADAPVCSGVRVEVWTLD